MTSQEKKRYLLRYRYLAREVDRLTEERAEALSRAGRITPILSDMPKAPGGTNRLELAVEKLLENADELSEKIREALRAKREIETAIDRLQDPTLRQLMKYHYIDGNTWEQVAVRMQYSWRQTVRLHGKALNVIECHIESMI